MSTTPSISSNPDIPYTVVGGLKSSRITKYESPLTVVVLARDKLSNKDYILNEPKRSGNTEIIYLDGPNLKYDIEQKSKTYADVRFLLFKHAISVGEKINIGIKEARSRFVMVLWNDMKLLSAVLSDRFVDSFASRDALCYVPVLKNEKSELIPSLYFPLNLKRKLQIIPSTTVKDGLATILPFDFCGLYDKERFEKMAGYDKTIENAYWQKLDFGYRSVLWGEKIICDTSILLRYDSEMPLENATTDPSYKKFYLKNIALKVRRGRGVLPLRRFFRYLFCSDTGPLSSWKEFRQARSWVAINSKNFQTDSRNVVKQWNIT